MSTRKKHIGPAPHTKGHRKHSQDGASSNTQGKHPVGLAPATQPQPAEKGGPTSPSPPPGSPDQSRGAAAHARRESQTSQHSAHSQHSEHSRENNSPRSHSPETGAANGEQEPHSPRSNSPQDQDQEARESPTPSLDSQTRTSPSTLTEKHFTPVEPEDFDTKSFISTIDDLDTMLDSDNFTSLDTEFDTGEMREVVEAWTVSMENFRNYTSYSQRRLEGLRGKIHDTKERMHRKVHLKPYDPASAEERMSLEERELQEKVASLNKSLGHVAEELTRAQQVSAETEFVASQTALLAERARAETQRIQAEYEARREADEAERRELEARRERERRMREEAERRESEERQREQDRRSKLKRDDQAQHAIEWTNWPTFTYRVSVGEFDHGIGCIVRGEPNHFRENDILCEKLPLLTSYGEMTFNHEVNEELVGNVIEVTGEVNQQHPLYLVMPHCTTRASAMSREPVIKTYSQGEWRELKSEEVHLDAYKDLKLVQAKITQAGKFAVVTRYKRDYLHFMRKGGKVTSNVEHRLVLSAERGTFSKRENFVLQMQPVDSGTVAEVRKNYPAGKGLLVSSSLISMEWTSQYFEYPITFQVPVPPNPVKARKHAAARAAREAKRKNPAAAPPPGPVDKEEEKRKKQELKRENQRKIMAAAAAGQTAEEEEDQPVIQKPQRWYMGQYGTNEDDEDDLLHFIYCDQRGKWQVHEDLEVTQVKLDVVQFSLPSPHLINKFMIIRTKTDVDAREALNLSHHVNSTLVNRVCNFIIRQKSEDPYDVKVYVTQHNRTEKALQSLTEEGYDDGPGSSADFVIREGDHVGVSFRGNVTAIEEDLPNLDLVFTSQQTNCLSFELTECNKFLQKSYNVFRGFVQLQHKTPLVCIRRPRKKTKDLDPAAAVTSPRNQITAAMQYETRLLTEQLVSIPKDVDVSSAPVTKAPVILRNTDDVINDVTLQRVAGDLGDEWQQLGACLGVRRVRIQAILRNTAVCDDSDLQAKHDMLLTWVKSMPRSVNKVEVLRRALAQVGRDDLADDLHDMNEAFQRQRKSGH